MHNRSHELLEFLERSGVYLYTLLARLTLRQDIAEDLMQELFIKLSNSGSFERAEKAQDKKAFARRVAINLAFDWWQKQKRESKLLNNVPKPDVNYNSPLDKLIAAEQLEKVFSGIGQLKGVSREAFVMRHIQQESFVDIAEQLNKTEHQVRALCHKAMGRLLRILEERPSPKDGL